jgi:hypothetical protein
MARTNGTLPMDELLYRLRMNPSDKTKASMQRDCEAAVVEIERLRALVKWAQAWTEERLIADLSAGESK